MAARTGFTGYLVNSDNPQDPRHYFTDLNGQRQIPQPTSRDTAVPGRDGVIASLNDDMPAGVVALSARVTSRQVDGGRPADNRAGLDQFHRNLDSFLQPYLPSDRLIDLRMPVGPDDSPQYNVLANPRMDQGSGTTQLRWNTVLNPSFEALGVGEVVRTNLNPRPNFGYGSIAGYTAENCTLGWSSKNNAIVMNTSSAGGITASVLTQAIVVPTAPADRTLYVQMKLASAQRMAILPKGSTALALDNFAVRARYSTDGGTTWTATSYRTGDWHAPLSGGDDPVFQFRQFGWSLTIPAAANRVKGEILWFPRQRQTFDGTYMFAEARDWLVELTDQPGPYFDGDSSAADLELDDSVQVAWSGSAGASKSTIAFQAPFNWTAFTGVRITPTSDKLRNGTRGCLIEATADIPAGAQLFRSAERDMHNAQSEWLDRTVFSARISLSAFDAHQPTLTLRVGFYDASQAFLGYGQVDGAEAGVDFDFNHAGYWYDRAVEGTGAPAGAAFVCLIVCASEPIEQGTQYVADQAICEPTGNCPRYFDGDSGPRYAWDDNGGSTPQESWLLGAGVQNWSFVGGTGSLTTAVDSPVEGDAVARFQVTGTPGQPTSCYVAQSQTPAKVNRRWQAGVHVQGNTAITWVGVTIHAYDSSNTLIAGFQPTNWTQVDGWTWCTMPIYQAPADAVKLTAYFFLAGGGSKPVAPAAGQVVYLAGGMLSTVDGDAASVEYFDQLSPGCRYASGQSGTIKRLPMHRQALCKLAGPIQPEIQPSGNGWVADLAFGLEIPGSWWQSPEVLTWSGDCNPNGAKTMEVTNLQGSTGRIEDAVIVVTGPAVNPRVTDPATGAWVQLDGTLTAGQAWRIDCQERLSGIGSKNKAALSGGWSNVLDATNYKAVRPGTLLPLTPDRDGRVRVSVARATAVQIVARQKWA